MSQLAACPNFQIEGTGDRSGAGPSFPFSKGVPISEVPLLSLTGGISGGGSPVGPKPCSESVEDGVEAVFQFLGIQVQVLEIAEELVNAGPKREWSAGGEEGREEEGPGSVQIRRLVVA